MNADARLAPWLERACDDPVMAASCRGLDVALVLETGEASLCLRLHEPCAVMDAPGERPQIRLTGPADAFREILTPAPPPGAHSYGALKRLNEAVAVTADPLIEAQALAALERLFELARPRVPAPRPTFARDEAAVRGSRRDVVAEIDGRAHHATLSFLDAGAGTPLLFLHTAGADARQFRHQLADTALQARFAMSAFDLPFHGSASGIDGCEAPEPYRLTEAAYLAWCVAVLRALAEPAIVVGCSMGAAMALTLAARRPDLVRAAIALEAPLRAPGRRNPLLSDARVAGARHNPSYVRALLSPTAPQPRRDEACAIYAQARPGIYEGDLAYYSDEYDGAAIAPLLKDRPIALLTGRYDYSASPQNTQALVDAIGGAWFRVMDDLGHFPMIEDPDRFRPHFLASLEAVTGERVP